MGIYYTIQTLGKWEEAKKKGYLKGDGRYAWRSFLNPYHWMIQQMNKRIKHDNSFPIWVWLEKPDMREEKCIKKDIVRLTIKLDDAKVLVSDFLAWHNVLNNGYCSLSEEEDDMFQEQNKPKEETWERIFDLKLLKNSWISCQDQELQGVVGKIDMKNIIKIEYFYNKTK